MPALLTAPILRKAGGGYLLHLGLPLLLFFPFSSALILSFPFSTLICLPFGSIHLLSSLLEALILLRFWQPTESPTTKLDSSGTTTVDGNQPAMATSRFCMRSAMRAFTTYLAFTTLFASSANGFFPTNWRQRKFGNDGTSHEAMTDQMYDDLVAIYFPEITIRSNGMTKARKTITKANIAVDDDLPNLTAAHFDGENFEGGQERLATLFQEVIDKLDADDAEGAQMALGGAMHTLQV